MSHEARKYLFDMQKACGLIEQFAKGKHFVDYQTDALLRAAIERQCQIIGEALSQLSKTHPEVAIGIPHLRDIINFRHVLVHGYDKVDDEVVWGVVLRHLPVLREALDRLLPPQV